jgi:hypothetical protein
LPKAVVPQKSEIPNQKSKSPQRTPAGVAAKAFAQWALFPALSFSLAFSVGFGDN